MKQDCIVLLLVQLPPSLIHNLHFFNSTSQLHVKGSVMLEGLKALNLLPVHRGDATKWSVVVLQPATSTRDEKACGRSMTLAEMCLVACLSRPSMIKWLAKEADLSHAVIRE